MKLYRTLVEHIRYICVKHILFSYSRRRSLFQRFFCLDAEALFPKMKEDVCLSAPVVLERTAGPLKTRAHKPQSPITMSTRKKKGYKRTSCSRIPGKKGGDDGGGG